MSVLIERKTENIVHLDPIYLHSQEPSVHAAWLRLPKLPLEQEHRHLLVETLTRIQKTMEQVTRKKIVRDIYLQMTQLERPSGSLLISRNGSRWKPAVGLGVWPDREPPQPLNEDDYKMLSPGQTLRETTFQVMRICAQEEEVRAEVIDRMAGTGALLTILAGENWGLAQQDDISKYLEASITADAFMGYPFYFPLLDATSLSSLHKEEFDGFFSDIVFYSREDRNENAVLIVSRIPLEALFPSSPGPTRALSLG